MRSCRPLSLRCDGGDRALVVDGHRLPEPEHLPEEGPRPCRRDAIVLKEIRESQMRGGKHRPIVLGFREARHDQAPTSEFSGKKQQNSDRSPPVPKLLGNVRRNS